MLYISHLTRPTPHSACRWWLGVVENKFSSTMAHFFAFHNLSKLLLLLCGSEKPQTWTKVVFQSSRAEKIKVSCLIFHWKLRVFHIQIKTMPNYTRDGDNLNFFHRVLLRLRQNSTQHSPQQLNININKTESQQRMKIFAKQRDNQIIFNLMKSRKSTSSWF